MARKRKLAANGKLRPRVLFTKKRAARVRDRYGDETLERLRDEELVHELFDGQVLKDESGKVAGRRFLTPGSAGERESMAATARTLIRVSKFIESEDIWPKAENVREIRLGSLLLKHLAQLIDPNVESPGPLDPLMPPPPPRKLVVQARYDGKPEDAIRDWRVAHEVALEVGVNGKLTAAYKLVAEQFGLSERQVRRIWARLGPEALWGKRRINLPI